VAQVDQSQQLPNQATMNQFTQRQQLSMQLAREFGLRREESLKFQVNVADKGDRIDLKPSWCKGGRARSIDVKTQEQRQLLDKIKSVVGIPSSRFVLGTIFCLLIFCDSQRK
jgi:hypothetical protein